MPTSAKLVAALIMAITGFLTADAVRAHLPEAMPAKQLAIWSVVIPLICGWRVTGRVIRRGGYVHAINQGYYILAVSIFFTIFAFSAADMIKRSTRKLYDGPTDAIVSMFGIAIEMGRLLIFPGPLMTLLVGGLLCGLISKWADRKWG
ncbi:MAG: TrgA family protein [Litoreibacter sp.]|nr:TrgA family protein [Litoreibacter sp.]